MLMIYVINTGLLTSLCAICCLVSVSGHPWNCINHYQIMHRRRDITCTVRNNASHVHLHRLLLHPVQTYVSADPFYSAFLIKLLPHSLLQLPPRNPQCTGQAPRFVRCCARKQLLRQRWHVGAHAHSHIVCGARVSTTFDKHGLRKK